MNKKKLEIICEHFFANLKSKIIQREINWLWYLVDVRLKFLLKLQKVFQLLHQSHLLFYIFTIQRKIPKCLRCQNCAHPNDHDQTNTCGCSFHLLLLNVAVAHTYNFLKYWRDGFIVTNFERTQKRENLLFISKMAAMPNIWVQ